MHGGLSNGSNSGSTPKNGRALSRGGPAGGQQAGAGQGGGGGGASNMAPWEQVRMNKV